MGGRSTTGERKAEGGESSALASLAEASLERLETNRQRRGGESPPGALRLLREGAERRG